MQHKFLASICAILLLAALAGCGDDDEKSPLDWSKIAGYDSTDGELILGTAAAALDGTNGRYQETVLGNFIMDAIAEYARYVSGENIDLALHNGQNLGQSSLPAGSLSNSTILALIGADRLFVCTYTGLQVKEIINTFVKSTVASGSWNANCAVLVSKEVSYTINTNTTPPEATNIKVHGADINEDLEYRVALGDFIGNASNPLRFPVLDADKKTDYLTPLKQAIAMYVLAKGTIKPSDYPSGRRITGVVPTL
jgi:2',3'-cyclic-nucleotide 2'-phosphodiesterase (5'-nucleotidase family)